MDFIEELNDELPLSGLESAWEDQLEGMIEEEPTREDLLEWVDGLRKDFLDFADAVDDPEEVKEALVTRYVELQCHWQMLNTKMQYQAVNTGQPDQALMVKGSLLSKLLEKLENLLGGTRSPTFGTSWLNRSKPSPLIVWRRVNSMTSWITSGS